MKVCVTYDFLMVPLLPIPSIFLPGHLPCQAEILLQRLCLEHAPGTLLLCLFFDKAHCPNCNLEIKLNQYYHLPWNPGMIAFHKRTGWHSHKNISIAGRRWVPSFSHCCLWCYSFLTLPRPTSSCSSLSLVVSDHLAFFSPKKVYSTFTHLSMVATFSSWLGLSFLEGLLVAGCWIHDSSVAPCFPSNFSSS